MLKHSYTIIALSTILIWMTKGGLSYKILESRDDECDFPANIDLYGFGIRLGVYLQWFSSWICNTLNPKLAADNHDINSIFVLALLCALCAANSTIQDVEIYIMLLTCYGYLLTVLTVFGIRVRLLSPATLRIFLQQMFSMWQGAKHGLQMQMQRLRQAFDDLVSMPVNSWQAKIKFFIKLMSAVLGPSFIPGLISVPLKTGSALKLHLFSWAGVLIRMTIAAAISMCSFIFWIGRWHNVPAKQDCPRSVFFFGTTDLKNPQMMQFAVVVSIAFAIPACTILLNILTSILKMAYKPYFTQVLTMTRVSSTRTQRNGFLMTTATVFDYILKFVGFLAIFPFEGVMALRHVLVTPDNTDVVHVTSFKGYFKKYLKAILSLCQDAGGTQDASSELVKMQVSSSVLWTAVIASHLYTGVMIFCFIFFIEKTIILNGLTDAYTLNVTSQLIPFIVGLASFLSALREIAVTLTAKTVEDAGAIDVIYNLNTGFQIKQSPVKTPTVSQKMVVKVSAASQPTVIRATGFQNAKGQWL